MIWALGIGVWNTLAMLLIWWLAAAEPLDGATQLQRSWRGARGGVPTPHSARRNGVGVCARRETMARQRRPVKWRRAAIGFAIGLVATLALVTLARAITDADTFTIVDANAYSGALESGDLLLIIHYDIGYDSCCPTETANQSFLGSYYDVSTSNPIRSEAPYVFVNSGYGQGVIGVYFDGSDVSALGIACGDADLARISGNPAVFPAPQVLDTTITCRATSDPADEIETDIDAIANLLDQRAEWAGVGLISGGFLTTNGEDYFENSIPNLRIMAPELFQGSFETPDFIEDDHGTGYRDSLKNFFAGSRFEDSFDNFADWTNLGVTMAKFVFWMALTFAVAGWVMMKTQLGVTGFPVMGILIPIGSLMGMIDLQFAALIGFLGFWVIVWVLILKRTNA